MRRYLFLALLCVIFFILPLNLFIIGDYAGIGVQGAVYRFQSAAGYGTSFFPITRELSFVLNGTYVKRTALSIILWALGTVLLACTMAFSFIHVNDKTVKFYQQMTFGLLAACACYMGSCIAQYGFLFNGPAGISLPIGIIIILCWLAFIYYYNIYSKESRQDT
jgi:hypothetical protein